ncbi:hypothetical protein [Dokdonella sp.]|uniref:hypothetical protein n=1 Tax=Dokdonella sp. TaxID=2291710 RepID=UPI00352920AE
MRILIAALLLLANANSHSSPTPEGCLDPVAHGCGMPPGDCSVYDSDDKEYQCYLLSQQLYCCTHSPVGAAPAAPPNDKESAASQGGEKNQQDVPP